MSTVVARLDEINRCC